MYGMWRSKQPECHFGQNSNTLSIWQNSINSNLIAETSGKPRAAWRTGLFSIASRGKVHCRASQLDYQRIKISIGLSEGTEKGDWQGVRYKIQIPDWDANRYETLQDVTMRMDQDSRRKEYANGFGCCHCALQVAKIPVHRDLPNRSMGHAEAIHLGVQGGTEGYWWCWLL